MINPTTFRNGIGNELLKKEKDINYKSYLYNRLISGCTITAQDTSDTSWLSISDLPTCLLCVCLTGSVYCEEVAPEMTSVPALPQETAYFYARYNKITKITAKDFEYIGELCSILLQGTRDFLVIATISTFYYSLYFIGIMYRDDLTSQ